jgi:hypothetical protein
MAQAWVNPMPTAVHVSGMAPVVSTAVGDAEVPLPAPLPRNPEPQHHAVPSPAMAHVSARPPATARHVSGMAPVVSTAAGDG